MTAFINLLRGAPARRMGLVPRFTRIARELEGLAALRPSRPATLVGREMTQGVDRLARLVSGLPEIMRPAGLSPKPRTRTSEGWTVEAVETLMAGAMTLFPTFEPTADFQSLGPMPSGAVTGLARPLPQSLISYRVIAVDEEEVTPLPPDPPHVTMKGYRVGELAALFATIVKNPRASIILVPGFTGTGKSRNLVPFLMEALMRDGAEPRFIPTAGRREWISELRAAGKADSFPYPLILDDISFLEAEGEKRLLELGRKYLERGGRMVWIGGGFLSTEGQRIFMRELALRAVAERHVVSVPIEAKPLNFRQAVEILTGRSAGLSFEERILYTDFTLSRLAPYLRVLRQFRLNGHGQSLEEGLAHFRTTFVDSIDTILARANVFPEGASPPQAVTSQVTQVAARLDSDIAALLAGRQS